MRDAADTCIAVCSMENVDPLGVHTGDSIVVAPVQTLSDPDAPAAAQSRRWRSSARSASRAAATSSSRSRRTTTSTRSSRSTRASRARRRSRPRRRATRSRASPPRSRSAAQLDEIPNAVTGKTVAAFEPALDYVVVKLPRFPFDKFPGAERGLGSQMKATGEVMAIERTFGAALNKALRGLEQTRRRLAVRAPRLGPRPGRAGSRPHGRMDCGDFLAPSDSRLWRLIALLRRGVVRRVRSSARPASRRGSCPSSSG